MAVLFLILLVLAATCFAAASAGRPSRVNLLALGLLLWVLVSLISAIQSMAG